MKKRGRNWWMFSFTFFIFLSSFLVVKSIFILLFNASFTPSFILRLTPLYLIPAIDESQLLFFSLIVVLADTYLHIRDTKKNLLYSFIPTFIIIGGISSVIVSNDVSVEYTVYYVLFAILLIILVIDNKKTLPHPRKHRVSLPTSRRKYVARKVPVARMLKNKPSGTTTLSQLKGIKPAYATALEAVGIKTIEELAESDPETIIRRFEDKDIMPKVSQKTVERWIESARLLNREK